MSRIEIGDRFDSPDDGIHGYIYDVVYSKDNKSALLEVTLDNGGHIKVEAEGIEFTAYKDMH